MLHMDLFGPTNVKSLMKKSYCLVVTDDFSRFSWVFFLATKGKTSGIFFIIEIENQLDCKVKVIRCDNGTKFKNSVMNQFCEDKGIKREYNVARTPQQNRVAEKRNRTLIKAVRTMLVESKLPTTFWAEAVNTDCYVLNRALVTKPHNKTPYELIRGRSLLINFMKPFGCPVTILNTKDNLGKFERKADEGYFVGYSVVRNRLDWLFDIDYLTTSMNYVPIVAGNQTNGIAGSIENLVAGTKDSAVDAGKKASEVDESEALDNVEKNDQVPRSEVKSLIQQERQTENINSTNSVNTATMKVKKVNDKEQIQALVDKTKVIITEDSIRSDLHFDDAEGTAVKTTAWNEFSSTIASVIMCLAGNQKFNFSKYIFDNMVKSLEGGVKFYRFLRFLQVFLDKQVEGMARNKELYIISSHTRKIFANIRRIRASFSEVTTPLFNSMMVQATVDMGDTPVETHQTPIVDQPSTSKPQKKQQPRRKQRKESEVSHDESEDEDHVPTPSSDLLPSGEDSSILNELMVFCTSLQEQDGLGAQEDASKQGRMIEEIDQNAEIALDDKTQGRTNDNEMFGVNDLDGEEVVMETTTSVKDSAAPIKDVVVQEQEMSTTIPAAATIVTTAVPTPRAKDNVFHEQKQSQIPTVSSLKDKGKAKMIEPEVPVKRKEQMRIDEDFKHEKREKFSEGQKARLLVKLIEKRKKHFAALRAQEKKNKPPTKNLMKSQMSTYLKHMGGYKQSYLKRRSFDEIKKLFDREMTKVNDFIAMDSEAQESSTKRIAKHLEYNISKKQKVDKNVEPSIDDSEELRMCIELVSDDGDVLIKATPISSRSPTIIDYKIHKEGKKTYFKIIEADGNSQVYQTFEKMYKNFNREDLEVLWDIVKDRFKKEKPVDDMDNILFRTLKPCLSIMLKIQYRNTNKD
nr:putative ribonuclease H-like domain-containing protein [Tanacetum cinerariifolium]